MNPLPTYINLLKPRLENKGWYVHYNDYYLGVSGYTKKKGQTPTPRPEHIISLCYFQPVSAESEDKDMMWEVKTFWTIKRLIFEEFEPAYKVFLEEEKKYDPKKIVWTRLASQEK